MSDTQAKKKKQMLSSYSIVFWFFTYFWGIPNHT